MPLQVSNESPDEIAKSFESVGSKPAFLVVYASQTDGRMWCGDCRDAEPFVKEKFANWSDVVRIVYAGQEPEYVHFLSLTSKIQLTDMFDRWKQPENIWKQAPFAVTALPTIIKVTGKVSCPMFSTHINILTNNAEMGETGGRRCIQPNKVRCLCWKRAFNGWNGEPLIYE